MRTTVIGLAALGLWAVSGAAQDAADDLKKMEGAWKTLLHEANGKPTPKDEVDKTAGKLIVKGAKYKVYFGDTFVDEGTITLNAAKTPREIDVKTSKDEVMKGIYKIEGDKMTVCFAQPGGERPAAFKTKEGQMLLGYERMKK